jgi:tetratricopeptide (TPR) repeat protein
MTELGNPDQALPLLMGIPASSQYYVDSRLLLCNILLAKDRRDSAIAIIAEARVAAPGAAQLVLAHGTLHEEAGRFEEAKNIYVSALPKFPKESEIFFRLAYVEDKLGNQAACIKALTQAIDIDPNHAEALNYLAYTWALMGENLDEALVMALKANNLKPNNGHIVDTVAWVYFVMGDVGRSLPLLEQAARLSGEDPMILEHLGDALAKSGRGDEARRAYDLALRRGHEQPGVISKKLESISN